MFKGGPEVERDEKKPLSPEIIDYSTPCLHCTGSTDNHFIFVSFEFELGTWPINKVGYYKLGPLKLTLLLAVVQMLL